MTAVAERAARNGTVPDEFPVDSFRDAARHLRRPFTANAVKFKVQATWPKEEPTGGLIVAYIDARLVVERLNTVIPHLWHDAYRQAGNTQMWCDLTIDEITRSDVGEGNGKGLVSDALKRAAVKFGIGVSLYAIPKMMLDTRDGSLKQKPVYDPKTKEQKKTLILTPQGETLLRGMYEHWLEEHGAQAFGKPLDHGDAEGAQGDVDDPAAMLPDHDDEPLAVEAEEVDGVPVAETITADQVHELVDMMHVKGIKAGEIRASLKTIGVPTGYALDSREAIEAVLGTLTPAQGRELNRLLRAV